MSEHDDLERQRAKPPAASASPEKDASAACDLDSKAKKLAGAALDAHMKKCVADAVGAKAPSCADMATEKKLAGAAADSFTKKCEADKAAAAAPAAKPAEAKPAEAPKAAAPAAP